MENMVNVYFYGKKYSVPGDLTIMTAMEYAGYTLKRGCGCRHGFCGACASIYRIMGKNELKTCLACQTQVQEGMYVASIPFFPTDKRTYNIEDIKADQRVMMELYPEIYACIGCNACTKACTQSLNVMQYIAPETEHLKNRVAEINSGAYDELIEAIMQKPITEMQELYNNRDIEK